MGTGVDVNLLGLWRGVGRHPAGQVDVAAVRQRDDVMVPKPPIRGSLVDPQTRWRFHRIRTLAERDEGDAQAGHQRDETQCEETPHG